MHCPLPTASAMASRSSMGLAGSWRARGHPMVLPQGRPVFPSNSRLLLDRAAEFSDVLAKSVTRIRRAFREVISEAQLRSERRPGTDRVSLGAFALPDGAGGFEDLFGRIAVDKNAAVVIGENDVVNCHGEFTEGRGLERVGA